MVLVAPDPALDLDQLRDRTAPIEVVRLDDWDAGSAAARGPRAPHRHAYHELLWARDGELVHNLDGRRVAVSAGTITVIGRGQVHVLEQARDLHGAVVRFTEQALLGELGTREGAAWLLAARSERVVAVPRGDVPALEATVDALAAEMARPPDRCSAGLQRHLLSAILLWIERWHDAARIEQPDAPDDGATRVYRRFVPLLESGFRRHHDAAHYAAALELSPDALAKALRAVTGATTKQLITERVMLEAERLLRFGDAPVGEIAERCGFADALYFSRAFKRHTGVSPLAYRDAARGG